MRMRGYIARLLALACLAVSCYSERDAEPAHTPKTFALQRNKEAVEALKAGRPDEALAKVNEAIEDDPEFHLAYANKASILGKLGRHAEAAEALAEALRRRPDFTQAYVLRGIFLERAGRKEEALACYARAVEVYDQDPQTQDDPAKAVDRAIAIYLLHGKVNGVTEMNAILKRYPKYTRVALLKEHMLAGDRAFFLRWGETPEPPSIDTNEYIPTETEG